MVSFGHERVSEHGTAETFFSPEGGVYLFLFGHSPVLVELIADGHYVPASGANPPAVVFAVPFVETVTGAPPMSLTDLDLSLGSTRSEGTTTVGSLVAPDACTASMAWGVAALFANPEGGGSSASAETASPCLAPSKAMIAEEEARKLAELEERRAQEARELEESTLARVLRELIGVVVPHRRDARVASVLRHSGWSFLVSLPAGVSVAADWYQPRGAHSSRRAPVLVATASAIVAQAGKLRIFVRLTRAGRRALKRRRTGGLRLTARVTIKGPGGPSATRTLTFRLAR